MSHENIVLVTVTAGKSLIDSEELISEGMSLEERFRVTCRTVNRSDCSWLIPRYDETPFWLAALSLLLVYSDEEEKEAVIAEAAVVNAVARGDLSALASMHAQGGDVNPVGLLNIFKEEYLGNTTTEDPMPEEDDDSDD